MTVWPEALIKLRVTKLVVYFSRDLGPAVSSLFYLPGNVVASNQRSCRGVRKAVSKKTS